jgi:DNA polymerase (family 10)
VESKAKITCYAGLLTDSIKIFLSESFYVLNAKIAELFNEIADMLELEGESRKFETLAYRKAAVTVGSLQEDVGEIYRKQGAEGLMHLPGIGRTMADRIREYVEKGRMSKYDELKKKYPIDFAGLTKIQGMGSKKAFRLYKELGVRDIDGLKKAIGEHRVRELQGFGARSEEEIGKGIAMLESGKGRLLLGTALPEAEEIRQRLADSGLVDMVMICGSTRRMRETVGDLDILIASGKGDKVMDFVTGMPEVERTMLRGPTKVTVMLKIGLSCDFRLVEPESFGAAVQYFTGSKNHNVKLREIAIREGYKLNEYGLFDRRNRNVAKGADEAEIYAKLGLDYMEPEMREDRGELDLARRHKVPRLVQLEDIAGDLHVHSDHSDGAASLEEMASAAAALGRRYVGFTDHTKSEHVANGMDDRKFLKYFGEIDDLNDRMKGRIRLLKSGEVDILKDGKLDLRDSTLERMDYVLASVHMNLNMDTDAMTARVVKAIRSGMVDILGHPTDRLIGQREPIRLDLDKVFAAAADEGVVMEINSYPDRLDLNDENIIKARGYGLRFSIDTDAHRTSNLGLTRYGIGMAKRGWLTKGDVVNTMELKDVLKLFRK